MRPQLLNSGFDVDHDLTQIPMHRKLFGQHVGVDSTGEVGGGVRGVEEYSTKHRIC